MSTTTSKPCRHAVGIRCVHRRCRETSARPITPWSGGVFGWAERFNPLAPAFIFLGGRPSGREATQTMHSLVWMKCIVVFRVTRPVTAGVKLMVIAPHGRGWGGLTRREWNVCSSLVPSDCSLGWKPFLCAAPLPAPLVSRALSTGPYCTGVEGITFGWLLFLTCGRSVLRASLEVLSALAQPQRLSTGHYRGCWGALKRFSMAAAFHGQLFSEFLVWYQGELRQQGGGGGRPLSVRFVPSSYLMTGAASPPISVVVVELGTGACAGPPQNLRFFR